MLFILSISDCNFYVGKIVQVKNLSINNRHIVGQKNRITLYNDVFIKKNELNIIKNLVRFCMLGKFF